MKAGYSILTYDRLGTGESDKPDAYDIVQLPLEVEILKEMAKLARAGTLMTSSKHYHHGYGALKFDKIVLVGHSLGSGLSLGVLSKYSDMVDGAVSTGFVPTGKLGVVRQQAFGLEYAPSNNRKFHDRGSGYVVQATRSNIQQIFFKKGYFDEKLLAYAEIIKQTGTVGEFGTFGELLGLQNVPYTGPLLVC